MRPLLVALAVLLIAHPAAAWLREGHMATGAMTFDALEHRDPDAVAAILRLMQAHPERARLDRELGATSGRARDRRLFELMAVWPDQARGGPFDHDRWHYSQAIVSSVRHVFPFAVGGAEEGFRRSLALVRDPGAAAADRAVALCWVMHIVGDMHQPLHTAVWLSWRFPLSDAGGNWAWVRRAADAAPERLHWFWDSAGRPPALPGSPDAFVAELQRTHPMEAEPAITDPQAALDLWAGESRALAHDAVYASGTLRPGVDPASAPVLDPIYVERARQVGAARIAAAGNRIGLLLLGVR